MICRIWSRTRQFTFLRDFYRCVNEWSRTDPDLELPDGNKWAKHSKKQQRDHLIQHHRTKKITKERDPFKDPFANPPSAKYSKVDIDGIPLDLYHDLRRFSSPERKTFYPFSVYDQGTGRQNHSRQDNLSNEHKEKIANMASLLSNLSSPSSLFDAIKDMQFAETDIEDLIYELESRGRQDIALYLLNFQSSDLSTKVSSQFSENFIRLLIQNNADVTYLFAFLDVCKKQKLKISIQTVYHVAQLFVDQGKLEMAIEVVLSVDASKSMTAVLNRFIENSISVHQFRHAFQLHHEMKCKSIPRDVYTYAALIKCSYQTYDHRLMFDLFEEMKFENIQPDLYIYNLLIRSCERTNNLHLALNMFEEMKGTVICNSKTYNCLLSLCARNGKLTEALEIFDKMTQSSEKPTTLTVNSLVQCCVRSGKSALAPELFEKMRHQYGLQPDAFTFATLFRACAKIQDSERAAALIQEMRATKIKVDVVTYTAAMDVFANCSDGDGVLNLFHLMIADGVQPNQITKSVLVRACANIVELPVCFRLLSEMKTSELQLELDDYNAILEPCSKTGNVEKALGWKSKMMEDSVAPDSTTFTLLITTCSIDGNWEMAKSIFDEMVQHKTIIQIEPFNAFLKACCLFLAYTKAMEVFESLKSNGPKPNDQTYTALIELCQNMEKIEQAHHLYSEMIDNGWSLDDRIRRRLRPFKNAL